MEGFLKWFTGGEHYNYHTLFHCMDNDLVSITIAILLCLGVFTGYLVIAYRWYKAALSAPDSQAKQALNDLKWIFIFCACCGYLWVILESVWPAWRLYIVFLAGLNFYTWRYVLRIESLESVYNYLKDRDDLIRELEKKENEIERLRRLTS